MASMKDISRACGVSIATVSKALNNHKDIGEETKEHIRRVAKEMGYFPNSSARALKTNRTYSIGVLFADESMSGLTHDYFANVLDSFKRTVENRGYDITFLNASKNRKNKMTYLEHCRYRGYDGVVIACTDFTDAKVIELVRSDIPVVTIDYVYYNNSAIVSDNAGGMRDLVKYIYEQGHRKIAYIYGNGSAVTRSRLSSFYKTTEELGLHIPDEYVREAAYRDTQGAGERTKELLGLENPPTCILYPDDFSSLGGINVIREMGLRIPEDISIAGYDGIGMSRHIEPQLTTLVQDTEKIGAEAGNKLLSQIENPKTTVAEQVMVGGKVCSGKTVGRI